MQTVKLNNKQLLSTLYPEDVPSWKDRSRETTQNQVGLLMVHSEILVSNLYRKIPFAHLGCLL